MATTSQAQAVKSLNTGPGRKRFVFKSFSQRIVEIDIDVYRSIYPLKAEPSQGSSFFLDCLIEWRELNTAEDFISFYEEMMPLVQTLPEIIHHKKKILTKLLSRLHMRGRLSLEPILRLVAALSRDLLKDFCPFLRNVADTLVYLLKSGADREPEIIEQIFTSWSSMMMYLQKYLVRNVVHVLRVTARLRYYCKDYIREFIAEAVSFLLRNAPPEQLIKGVRKVMVEVAKKPVASRKSGASALLWYAMRLTSSNLHSKAERVYRLLVDKSIFCIGDNYTPGNSVVQVVTEVFRRLCEELDPGELIKVWNCLYDEINGAVSNAVSKKTEHLANEYLLHLSHLLSLLISTIQFKYVHKLSDHQPIIEVVQLLMREFVLPSGLLEDEDLSSEVVDKTLHLMLCILDRLRIDDKVSVLNFETWTPVFNLTKSSLLPFIKELLLKDFVIIYPFIEEILRALGGLIETSEEEVIPSLLILGERLVAHGKSFGLLEGACKEEVSKIYSYLQNYIGNWCDIISRFAIGNSSPIELQETSLALLWGVICCHSYMKNVQANPQLLLVLVDALDQLLMVKSEYIAGFQKHTWQSLIGASLSSYNSLLSSDHVRAETVRQVMQLATRHRTSSHILSAVAGFLDHVDRSAPHQDSSKLIRCKELKVDEDLVSLCIFAENLGHRDKLTRLPTLKILCHHELINGDLPRRDKSADNMLGSELSQFCHADDCDINIFELLLSIEETQISVATSRKFVLMISKIQMAISAARISEKHLPAVLYGLIGILHNRFQDLWGPVLECLSTLINQKFETTCWDIFVLYLEQCQSDFLASGVQSSRTETTSTSTHGDLVVRFSGFVSPSSDNTPCKTVLSLLIQTLQKVPSLVESRTRQIVPLFLKFMGYNMVDVFSVESFDAPACKGREWRSILKEWLNLLKLMRNPKSLYRSQNVKEVLEYRLLDEHEAEIQMGVLDCLLNWKDEFLVPYSQHLKNLINLKSWRENITTWSLSKKSTLVQENHRIHLVPLAIRLLIPKVRKLKILASRKTSVHNRKTVLGFLAQLEVDELPLFFSLLMKPLLSTPRLVCYDKQIWSSSEHFKHDFDSNAFLENFTLDNAMALPLKKKNGFLHVIEDIFGVFDESHIEPYLDLLVGCINQILWSCTYTLDSVKSCALSEAERDSCFKAREDEKTGEASNSISIGVKQLKELRSFCLKIIAFILNKYEEHEFSSEFWDRFFMSVKPLIDGFKQEGASSAKPSSLFCCFLAMSRSYKLVPFLCKEKNLIPNIFSILSAATVSEAISSSVITFVENLLTHDFELDFHHLDLLICGLHHHFKFNNVARRKLVKSLGEREINIFKLLSKYIIEQPSKACQFVDILLPLLSKGVQNTDACAKALQVISYVIPVLGCESMTDILNAVCHLLTSVGLDIRLSICHLLNLLAGIDSSLVTMAKLVSELNATSKMHMGGLDYDRVMSAYELINKDFFYTVKEKHALVILSHAVHDIVSEERILRESGYGLLLSFVDFSAEILNRGLYTDDLCWSEVCIEKIITKFFFKHMGEAMNKESPVQKVWIDLLREMVLKLPKVKNLQSYRDLYSKDPEQDFFSNIVCLQKLRRSRALFKFKNFCSSGNLSQIITNKVFVPLFLNMLLDERNGNAENLRVACLETLATIAGNMEWKCYYAFLLRCFREMALKPDTQKVLLRLISSVLGQFHFLGSRSNLSSSSAILRICTNSAEASEIQECLRKGLLPKIQKLLVSDSDKINVNISLVALKLLKFLPDEYMDLHLPSIIHRISNFLKSRSDSSRDGARSALAACLKELGVDYIQFVVRVLKTTLKRGYELHVLGFTLYFILSKILATPLCGKLDYCLEELLSIVENDIFGEVSEEKEVEKIASKMKETRKCKSFETLKLIAESVTFKTNVFKLLSPVKTRRKKHLAPKEKAKLETMLSSIAAGIQENPSVNQSDLLIFLNGLIVDEVNYENNSAIDKECVHNTKTKIIKSGRLIDCSSQSSYLVTVFALGMLKNCIMNAKHLKGDGDLLSMVDPFVGLLTECLNSNYEDVISAALRCLFPIVKLPLPSLELQFDKIKTSLLIIAQGSVNVSSPLVQSCLKLLRSLLQNPRITISVDQLRMVINSPSIVDLERNPSSVALSLLNAIVVRKLIVHEIYDLVTPIKNLMLTSQVDLIRKKCSQILLHFFLGYDLSEKHLQQHIDFLLHNLRYEHSTGREAMLEMLHAIIEKFPKSILKEYSQELVFHLVACLANDYDNRLIVAALDCLIKNLGRHELHPALESILKDTLSWYLGGNLVGKQYLLSAAAAQILGLLIEAMGRRLDKHIERVLPVMGSIFYTTINEFTSRKPHLSVEAAAYCSLNLLEKILGQFRSLCLSTEHEGIWENVCELLLHPHVKLRDASNRLLTLYFASATEEIRKQSSPTLFLTRPSRLFIISLYLCCQLRAMLIDNMASSLITQNLTFTILTLHDVFIENKGIAINEFKSILEKREQGGFFKALDLLGSGKGRGMFASLIDGEDRSGYSQSLTVSFLLKRMGKIALQMNAVQMHIVFDVYTSVSQKILDPEKSSRSEEGYAYEMLLPLYKVCEGYTGKVIPDEIKQLAQETVEILRDRLGTSNFVQVYSEIRKHLKAKRDKRKQEEKLMAVVNPMRNAKRKMRIASKNKANKKRRVMTMKMSRWT